ncbi:MAG TPA: heavy metal translocating P-type ATPase, partial [Patescibacteria group bacterium]
QDTMLSQIIKLVQEAQGSKAPIQRLADVISSYFVPVVIMLAIMTFIVWYTLGTQSAFSLALLNTIAVLIIACPCAMGLATPTAIMVGTGKGALNGILIKDAASLEVAQKVNTVIFDKTGTLTNGKPEVTDVISVSNAMKQTHKESAVLFTVARNDILRLAASLEKGSEHSLAEAIVKKAEDESLTLDQVTSFKAVAGHGVEGKIGKKFVILGNRKLMDKEKILYKDQEKQIQQLEEEGKTVMLLCLDKKLAGLLAVADQLKASAKTGVKILQDMKIEVVMITGDNSRTAKAVAKQLGDIRVLAEVLPEDKEKEVKKIQATGATVAFVGDGINDAPALASANVGIAMGSGTDVAIEAADITLVNKNLASVAAAILLSKKTMFTIKTNLLWAFGYNVILIPVAAGVLYPVWGLLLNPIFASLAMAMSSVSVVGNSLLLKRVKLFI